MLAQNYRVGLLFLIPLLAVPVNAQPDSTFVKPFARTNDIEFNAGFYNRSFIFKKFRSGTYLSDHKLLANTSAYAGATLDYNWVSLSFSVNIPHTAVSNRAPSIKVLGLGIRKTTRRFQLEATGEQYDGLLMPVNRRTRDFDYLAAISYRSLTARVTYIFNSRRFSLPAATGYSVLQLRPAGSFLMAAEPSWQQFYLSTTPAKAIEDSDSAFVRMIETRPSVFSLPLSLGYVYNFVWAQGYWNLTPFAWLGSGLQRQTKSYRSFEPMLLYRFQLNGGYNSPAFYLYLNVSYERSIGRFSGAEWSRNHFDMAFTAGYRIGKLQKKIAGIL